MSPPRALLVDAVDTVIALRGSVAEIYTRCAREHGLRAEPEAVRERLSALRIEPPTLEGVDLSEIPAREREGWREIVRGALGDAAADGACFDALHAHFARPNAWRVLPGAREALERARARGARLGIVSNMDSRLEPLLEAFGLRALLDAFVVPSNSGLRKPDPRIFARALEQLQVAPGEALHVDDDPASVAAALACGLDALRFDPAAPAESSGALRSWAALDAQLG